MRYLIATILLIPSLSGKYIDAPADFIYSHFQHYHTDQLYTICIAGPEIGRYNEIRNFLETSSLEIAYINFGSEAADFSIGHFQIKPSFVERLENEICNTSALQAFQDLTFHTDHKEENIRKERLRRISDIQYSSKYLQAFWEYCEISYDLSPLKPEDKIRFIATAYNLGFDYDKETIISYQQKTNFPYGSMYKGHQYAYSELSVEIYHQLMNMLCKNQSPN